MKITSLTLKKAAMDQTSADFQKFFVRVFEQAPAESKIPAKFITFLDNFSLIMSRKKDGVQLRLKRLKDCFDFFLSIMGGFLFWKRFLDGCG